MTAAIDPKGMGGLSVTDAEARAAQYAATLEFYLAEPAVRRIVFAENSGYELSRFRDLVARHPGTEVEFMSLNDNDYPRHLGKSYGELRILDHIAAHSRLVQEAGGFAKVTGRFPILNLALLLREAEHAGHGNFSATTRTIASTTGSTWAGPATAATPASSASPSISTTATSADAPPNLMIRRAA